MTPEQIKELASRLQKAASERGNLPDDSEALAADLDAAADLIRQMAEPPAPPDTKTEPITGTQVEVIHGPQSLSELDLTVYRRQISEMQTQPDDTALLRQALTLLIRYRNETPLGHQPHMTAHEADDAIAALRARLDGAPQPARELPPLPDGWTQFEGGAELFDANQMRDYARAAQPARVPMTDEQMTAIYREAFGLFDSRPVGLQIEFVRAIERFHGIRSE